MIACFRRGLLAFTFAGAFLPLLRAQVQAQKVKPFPPPLAYVESSSGLGYPELDGGLLEVEMEDVDRDGCVDLVSIGDHGSPYINTQEHGIMVWFGNGTGAGWQVQMNGDFGYGGIALGDLNGDGLVDAAYGMHHNYSGNDFGDQLIEAALGDGTGRNWTPWDDGLAAQGQSWGMQGTDLADVDGDGDLDLVSISFGAGDGLHVYRNEGDGTWTWIFGYFGGNSSCKVCFADVNGDGNPDIVAGHEKGTVYLGDGAGGFTCVDGNLPSTSMGFAGPSAGDVDGDGKDEVALCTTSGAVQVWRYLGAERWASLSAGLPTASAYAMTQLCDMDGDGDRDLVAFGHGTGTVWVRDAAGRWHEAASFQTGSPGYAEALRTGFDVDFNGRPDIVVVDEEGSWPNDRNHLHLFREASTPMALSVRLTRPLGGETFHRGAVVFVDWVAAVPGGEGPSASVDLDLSVTGPGGPWIPVAAALPPGGRYQWSIPDTVPASGDCRLRIRLHTPSGGHASFIPPESFTLD